MQRSNGDPKMKKLSGPEISGFDGKPPFWIIHLCSATKLTAKVKKLSGPETSSSNGKPPFWISHLSNAEI